MDEKTMQSIVDSILDLDDITEKRNDRNFAHIRRRGTARAVDTITFVGKYMTNKLRYGIFFFTLYSFFFHIMPSPYENLWLIWGMK